MSCCGAVSGVGRRFPLSSTCLEGDLEHHPHHVQPPSRDAILWSGSTTPHPGNLCPPSPTLHPRSTPTNPSSLPITPGGPPACLRLVFSQVAKYPTSASKPKGQSMICRMELTTPDMGQPSTPVSRLAPVD
ncbi:hypothetical protein BT67DRAFT_442271 [Trichocladium antarcticum]|uniref:Uncharacterized protein n=1 Tax=Trichocladium antarcticum TaxID=1450529 RepID=A0AAN6ZDI7_9PEZI|nr:hypothetical protein BT67DRAFT_442271 [Trichocladium antarcticum]